MKRLSREKRVSRQLTTIRKPLYQRECPSNTELPLQVEWLYTDCDSIIAGRLEMWNLVRLRVTTILFISHRSQEACRAAVPH